MTIIAADTNYLVVGLGATGLSCVRHLVASGKKVAVMDSRQSPPNLEVLQAEYPQVELHLGGFNAQLMSQAAYLVMSPGVPLATPEVQQAMAAGAKITSDIELFLQKFNGQVIAITGSNGKSTVTSWLGEALKQSGKKVLVAGNIGVPVLSALAEDYEIAVLELSSFQLELLTSLQADVATILNVSEDHMDRYDSYAHYVQAKQRIYFACKTAIFNREDDLTRPLVPDHVRQVSFAGSQPDLNQYGFIEEQGKTWLAHGFDAILSVEEISLAGKHNHLNALSVLALADAVGNDRNATLAALKNYSGLAYRCEFKAEIAGVKYYNDSKATNVGSTLAAISGLAANDKKNLIVLLGGQGKGQDFSPLSEAVAEYCKQAIVYGEDKSLLLNALPSAQTAEDLADAFKLAVEQAQQGDQILLSPACASFDQFKNFEQRGEFFNQLVEALR